MAAEARPGPRMEPATLDKPLLPGMLESPAMERLAKVPSSNEEDEESIPVTEDVAPPPVAPPPAVVPPPMLVAPPPVAAPPVELLDVVDFDAELVLDVEPPAEGSSNDIVCGVMLEEDFTVTVDCRDGGRV